MSPLGRMERKSDEVFLAVLAVLVVFVPSTSAQTSSFTLPDFGAERSYGVVGDVTIAGLFPIFEYSTASSGSQCSVYRGYGAINNAQAFTFVLERHGRTLSVRTDDGDWRNLSLGYVLTDMCGQSGQLWSTGFSVQLLDSSQARPRLCPGVLNASDLDTDDTIRTVYPIAVVGPTASPAAEAIAPLLSEYSVPLVSPEADSQEMTCSAGSEGLACRFDYEYFYRTISPDNFLAPALVDLAIFGFSWQFVGILYQNDVSGSTAAGEFLAETEKSSLSSGRPWRLCVAFYESIPTDGCCQNQLKRVVTLIKKHGQAKAIFLFAKSPAVSLLMREIVADVARTGQTLPRVWIGRDDHWGTGDIIKNGDFAKATLSAAIHLRSRLPPHLDWFYETIYKDFVVDNSRLSPQRLSDRNSPLNPWLCRDLETIGVDLCFFEKECLLAGDELQLWNDKTCNVTSALIRRLFRNDNGSYVDQLGASHTLLATETVIQALENLLQEFVRREPNTFGEDLASQFNTYAFGNRLNKAIGEVKLGREMGCRQEGGCEVFDKTQHDLGSPSYFILWTNQERKEQTIVGSWASINSSSNSSRLSMSPSDILSWGALEVRSGKEPWPSSLCAPICQPGYFMEPIPSLRCCHSCLSCGNTNYSNIINSPTCLQCGEYFLSNNNRTGCYPFPEKAPPNRIVWLGILGTAWFVIFVGWILTALLFFKKRETRHVQRNVFFNSVLIVTMVMCMLSIALYAVPASEWFCKNRSLFPTPWYIMSVATLLVRTFRLARVVKKYREGDTQLIDKLWSFRSPAQLIFILALTLIGVLLQVLLIFVKLDKTGTKRIYTDSTFYTVCRAEIRIDAIIDSYLIKMLFLSIGLAFRTRKLPYYRKAIFNREARPLFFVMFCLAAIWLIILTIRSLSSEENEDLLAIIRAIGHISSIWAWLFLPKIYAIFFQKERKERDRAQTLISLSGEVHVNPSLARVSAAAIASRPGNPSTARGSAATIDSRLEERDEVPVLVENPAFALNSLIEKSEALTESLPGEMKTSSDDVSQKPSTCSAMEEEAGKTEDKSLDNGQKLDTRASGTHKISYL